MEPILIPTAAMEGSLGHFQTFHNWHGICFSTSMYPLLAIAAAKIGSNIINNVAANVADNAKATSESNAAKKAAFDQMMAKVAASPKAKNTDFLRGEGITSRADAESILHQISQKILQTPEVSAITGGGTGAIDLKFLPDGNVSVKTADGTERVVSLEGNLKENSQKAHQIMESVKVAFSQNTSSANKGPGHLHIVPGGRSTLCV
jgi:hypothetical protein